MLPFPSLPWFELARFRRNRLTRAALVAVAMVPLFYGVLYVWANWDPAGNLRNVRAAVVNLDRPATVTGPDGEKRTVPVGRSLAGELTGSTAGNNFDWTLTTAEDARAGLDSGDYAAVVTIPENFSAAVTSTSREDGTRAEQAVLRVRSDDAHNYIAGTLARSVGAAATASLNAQVTETYLDNVYIGFTALHEEIGEAAEGAADLADGSRKLASGAARTDEGAGDLVVGLRELASGTARLSRGTGRIAGGASDLSGGAASLAAGLDRLDRGTRKLPAQSAQLDQGARRIAGGAGKLATGASTLAGGLAELARSTRGLPAQSGELASGVVLLEEGADALAAGATDLASGADDLAAGADELATGALDLSEGVEEYRTQLTALSAGCAASGAAPPYCTQLALLAAGIDPLATGASDVADGAEEVAAGAAEIAAGTGELRPGAAELHAGLVRLREGTDALAAAGPQLSTAVTRLAEGGSTLSGGASDLAGGAGRLARGTAQLAAAAPRLHTGISQAATGAGRLGEGSSQLAAGAAELDSGAVRLAEGASSAAGGASQLAEGTSRLTDGARELRDGSSRLADGLAEGAEEIPAYSEEERRILRKVAATPVVGDVARAHAVEANGAGLAPYFMALALWVGAMAVYMVLRALSARALVSTSPSWRIALAGYMPGTVLSAAQAVLLVVVLRFALGMDAADLPGLLLFAILVGFTFTAVNQALIATFGGVGRFLALIFVSLQLASAGGTYPIETAPAFFRALHEVLPMTHAVDGFRVLIAGGPSGTGHAASILVAWIAACLTMTVLAARRQRVWTMSRLHATQVV
ncbi:YhgE/Pip domain-containing protein [Planobispora longispora]|uniref:ABC-2 type transporter transmembrane domain-containing protein n=1 Tax=Planobispora longispora TaxID=28887 RepID=A0A8J3RMQ3_9ACTN|nr:YhgE/Pip domain-containing protein [Planobispora longispora]GIH77820.1 hypothetical protein Plo01_42490 [Planobispora longispora]